MAAINQTDLILLQITADNKQALKTINQTIASVQKLHQRLLPKDMRGEDTIIPAKQIKKAITDFAAAQRKQAAEEKNLLAIREKNFAKMKNNIMSAGLSMLFTGMALKKMFQDIATTATTTYNKINANTSLANNAVTRLAVSMDYVYYVIGDALASALDSLMPMILSVVDYITDWIEKNPELTGQLILWGVIISSVVMALGQLGLATLGIISALQLVGIIKGGSIFAAIGGGATAAAEEVAKVSTAVELLKGILGVALSLGITLIGWNLLENGLDNNSLVSTIAGAILTVGGAIGLGAATGKLLALAGVAGFSGPLALIFGITAGIIVTMKLLGYDFSPGGQDALRNLLYKLNGGKMKGDIPEQDISDIIHAEDPENWRINIEGRWERVRTTINDISADVNETIVPNTNRTLENIDATTNSIYSSVKDQELVVENMGKNAINTDKNLSVLADEDFNKRVTSIDSNITIIDRNMRAFSRMNFADLFRQQQNNSLSILSR